MEDAGAVWNSVEGDQAWSRRHLVGEGAVSLSRGFKFEGWAREREWGLRGGEVLEKVSAWEVGNEVEILDKYDDFDIPL